ncbi:hypothetical protein QAD02_022602 [Eretmocerus hayati]|uniref:Uncharacterized protein n=1 Tax=Eretmocerus hayati TaxID=131215 RepID=A0ACC2PUL0_9HYME|nr:hypothetical protein QAD02_022602 [Eretmocerus hayati]
MAESNVSRERSQDKLLPEPQKILIFSGKRKSGKDFITDQLFQRLGENQSVIIKLSGPIKSHWSKLKNLDADQLFSDGEYKEKYRLEMAKWGEEVRNKDHGYFCRAAITMYDAHKKSIWIISDARRKTDIRWFKENYENKCRTIRISTSEDTRKKRGWIFTKGIDDSETECDLDDFHDWDLEIENDNDTDVEKVLENIVHL